MERGIQGVAGRMKRYTKCITDDLKDIAIVGIHHGLQNGIVTRPQRFPLIRIFLREFRTPLDIGKKKCDCT